jgi:hypothetical protein
MKLTKIVSLSLLSLSTTINAAGYFRCTDTNGNTVFSQTSCGAGAEKQTTEETASTQTQGEKRSVFDQLESMSKIGPEKVTKKPRTSKKDDPCANVRSVVLRNARVGGDIMRCHTQHDVRSMFGEPNSTSTWSSGKGGDSVKWSYSFKDTSSLTVYFENGKVTDWRKWDWERHKDY